MKTSAVLFIGTLAITSLANATVAPIPLSAVPPIGSQATITVTSQLGDSVNGGGAFGGTLTNGQTYNTAFWCVDDQTYFNLPTTTPTSANITLLSDLSTAAGLAQTWYETATPGFQDTNVGLDAAHDTTQNRLLMAAYLVQQYDGYAPFTSVTGNTKDVNIQNAIWTLMNNSEFTSDNHWGPGSPTYLPNDSGVQSWLAQAAASYQSVSTNGWALVSWQAPVTDDNTANEARQTFLVKVDTFTPEPGFYGALSLGMTCLVFAINRKRKSA